MNAETRVVVLFSMTVALALLSACGAPQPTATMVPTSEPPVILTDIPPVPSTQQELPTGSEAQWDLVVIGDSTLWGLAQAFASQMEADTGVKVAYFDCAMGGLSAGRVLEALQTGESSSSKLAALPNALREAEAVVMFVNPGDSIDPEEPLDAGECFRLRAPRTCTPKSFEKYTADLAAIWAEILDLRAGQPTILRATDCYNPAVPTWKRYDIFDACTECWENMSHAARLAAEAENIPFLSRYDVYNGASHEEDPEEKGYIDRDGEHPSELMNQYTAELLSEMGYEPVTMP